MKELAIVLVSGGLDSCVTLAIANLKYELAFLHINYGQQTQSKELDAFNHIADFYKVKKKLVCDFNWLKEIGGSSLTDPRQGDTPCLQPQRQGTSCLRGDTPCLQPLKLEFFIFSLFYLLFSLLRRPIREQIHLLWA